MAKTNQSHHIRFKDAVETTNTISAALIARESGLNERKWFGYRFTSPWRATVQFMEVYNELLRDAVRSSIDVRLAKTVRGFAIADFKRDPRIRTQLWCARQRADDVGMRYEEYIGASFEFALRRQRKVLPQPNQLHHGANAQQSWIPFREEYWEERLRDEVVPLPDDPAYRVEHFQELPAQVAYRAFLLAMADQSTAPRGMSMQAYAVGRRHLPLDAFASIWPDEEYDRAVEAYEFEQRNYPLASDPLPAFQKEQLWPSCMGLPAARLPLSMECSNCPVRTKCAVLGELVTRETESATGSATPVEDRKRKQVRDRKRRQRFRAKTIKCSSVSPTASLPGTAVI